MEAHALREGEAAGSSPAYPTTTSRGVDGDTPVWGTGECEFDSRVLDQCEKRCWPVVSL